MIDDFCKGKNYIKKLVIPDVPAYFVESELPDTINIDYSDVVCPICAWKIIGFSSGKITKWEKPLWRVRREELDNVKQKVTFAYKEKGMEYIWIE
jgi:hypothetical protein